MKREIFIALNDFKRPNVLAIYGAHLAKQLDRIAFLFGVTEEPLITPTAVPPNADELERRSSKAEKELKAVTLDVERIYPHVYYDIGLGFNESTIVGKTESEDPYMVLLESINELTNLHEWFGTFETRLAERTNNPALVVPHKYEWKPVKCILYVMDLEDEKLANVRYLSDLSKELGAELIVVTIADEDTGEDDWKIVESTKKIQKLLNNTNVQFHHIFANGSSGAVERLMEHSNAEWLCFEHKSRSFLERIFSDYNTKHLILQSQKPVLVF